MREIKFRAFRKHGGDKEMIFSEGDWGYWGDNVMGRDDEYHIMQYTGLKDSKGKEIYEGDIVDIGDNIAFEVAWDNKGTGYSIGIGYPEWSEYKVIGNIYEDEKLLK